MRGRQRNAAQPSPNVAAIGFGSMADLASAASPSSWYITAALVCIRLPNEARAAMTAAMRSIGVCRSKRSAPGDRGRVHNRPGQSRTVDCASICLTPAWREVIYDGLTRDIVPGRQARPPQKQARPAGCWRNSATRPIRKQITNVRMGIASTIATPSGGVKGSPICVSCLVCRCSMAPLLNQKVREYVFASDPRFRAAVRSVARARRPPWHSRVRRHFLSRDFPLTTRP